jgi:hypothetical protein
MIKQSGNKNIASVKIVSSNQLKSGDLSVKTASNSGVDALRQFADDWAHRIGSGTTVQTPIFGVLAHGIRTSTMDMSKYEEDRTQILQENRPFIPQAEIRHIDWLTRDAAAKTASTITIEFTKPTDANKIIEAAPKAHLLPLTPHQRQRGLRFQPQLPPLGHLTF